MFELDARHLRQVLEICRAGSFARAAEALNIAQPTLSRSIARIEDRLRLQLFDRSGGGATPTVYGSYLARRAAEVLGLASGLANEVRQLAAGDRGHVRIGAGPATMEGVMPLVAETLIRRFPHLKLSFVRGMGPVLVESLARRELDIAVANIASVPHAAQLTEEKLPELQSLFLARPGHPLHRGGPYSFAEICAYPLAWPGMPTENRVESLRLLPPDRHDNYDFYKASDYAVLARLAMGGDAVAAGPAFVFRAAMAQRQLVPLPVTFPTPVPASLLMTREGAHSLVLAEVSEIVRDVWTAEANGSVEAAQATAKTIAGRRAGSGPA